MKEVSVYLFRFGNANFLELVNKLGQERSSRNCI
jgi:hypothetical protein